MNRLRFHALGQSSLTDCVAAFLFFIFHSLSFVSASVDVFGFRMGDDSRFCNSGCSVFIFRSLLWRMYCWNKQDCVFFQNKIKVHFLLFSDSSECDEYGQFVSIGFCPLQFTAEDLSAGRSVSFVGVQLSDILFLIGCLTSMF